MPKRAKPGDGESAETAEGFEGLLGSFRQAGGQEIEMATLHDLVMVARTRSLPLLRHSSDSSGGWTYFLVLDGAGRIAYRFNERRRPDPD